MIGCFLACPNRKFKDKYVKSFSVAEVPICEFDVGVSLLRILRGREICRVNCVGVVNTPPNPPKHCLLRVFQLFSAVRRNPSPAS